jgi:hypothetical protein
MKIVPFKSPAITEGGTYCDEANGSLRRGPFVRLCGFSGENGSTTTSKGRRGERCRRRQCRNYGAMPGTQTYTECRMVIAMQRKDIEAARDLQIQQNSAAMMMTGAAILSGR